MPEAKRKLGNYIIIAFVINVFAIMSVGGVCIMMVRDMVRNINLLEQESIDVSKADDIKNKIHKTIDSINQAVIKADKDYLIYASNIIEDVENEMAIYLANKMVSMPGHDRQEIKLLQEIQAKLGKIKNLIPPIYEKFSTSGLLSQTDLQTLERSGMTVQNLAEKLNRIHFEDIASRVQDSYSKMYFILFLYLVSSGIGILASCVGYIVLTRNTISPIKSLASATKKVAAGDLSIRVDTRSETEIGALYRSFNVMTEKLQSHEKRRDEFSRELEKQVAERTMELREANNSLRHAQDELVRLEKIAIMGQMAATVNHEIKTPLNSLYLNLQLLTRQINKCENEDPAVKEKMLKVTSIIDGEIIRISEILEEFVKYARFAPPELKEKDLNNIINKIAEMLTQSAREARVEIKLTLAEDLGPVMLDEKKITQAVLNLCVNAIHAMPNGGILVIDTAKLEHNITITITDNGTGIAEEDQKRIFEPFFTKKEKGMGFGLAIVQRIIEDHHGWITCSSEEGEYTIFEIVLPTTAAAN
ncbi:MAG: HAMP domain-containing protein [Proteobacteria bacterium]|nr:HAMP domain-containing protein [Pseudomonadota bacterium]MBU1715719.1 HAMP domain-containing protein [Pseudomonadota bacterium]